MCMPTSVVSSKVALSLCLCLCVCVHDNDVLIIQLRECSFTYVVLFMIYLRCKWMDFFISVFLFLTFCVWLEKYQFTRCVFYIHNAQIAATQKNMHVLCFMLSVQLQIHNYTSYITGPVVFTPAVQPIDLHIYDAGVKNVFFCFFFFFFSFGVRQIFNFLNSPMNRRQRFSSDFGEKIGRHDQTKLHQYTDATISMLPYIGRHRSHSIKYFLNLCVDP